MSSVGHGLGWVDPDDLWVGYPGNAGARVNPWVWSRDSKRDFTNLIRTSSTEIRDDDVVPSSSSTRRAD